MTEMQIVGIMLIRNEDVFVERAILNVIDFCDKLIITDHQSTDQTYDICCRLAHKYPKIDLRRIEMVRESSDAIAPYYNTQTWIFAVDGDEIFDPAGLQEMRWRLKRGDFLGDWAIFANTLNCVKLDLQSRKAWGYLAPPSRAGARLYNFSIIEDWTGATGERLHGKGIVFKPGYHVKLRRFLHEEMDWEQSYFRYVHASFLVRSSYERVRWVKTRLNPDELQTITNQKSLFDRIKSILKIRLAQVMRRDWKNQKYRRGPLVEKDISSFFKNDK